jgi:hypothetical protein
VSMVWHTSLECHAKVTMLNETRVWERRLIRVRRLEQA